MKSKKNNICRLNTILDETLPDMNLTKILGTSKSGQLHDPILSKSVLTDLASLESISTEFERLEDADAMSHFIEKYSSSHFKSLDELLAAHTSNPYEVKVQVSSHDNLFEGLESILGD